MNSFFWELFIMTYKNRIIIPDEKQLYLIAIFIVPSKLKSTTNAKDVPIMHQDFSYLFMQEDKHYTLYTCVVLHLIKNASRAIFCSASLY